MFTAVLGTLAHETFPCSKTTIPASCLEGKSPSAGPVTGISPTTPPSTTGVHNAPSTVAVSTPEISSQQASNASEAIESDAAHNPESDEEKLEGPAVPISHAQVNETGSVEGISTQAPNGTEIAERSTDTLQTTADKLGMYFPASYASVVFSSVSVFVYLRSTDVLGLHIRGLNNYKTTKETYKTKPSAGNKCNLRQMHLFFAQSLVRPEQSLSRQLR